MVYMIMNKLRRIHCDTISGDEIMTNADYLDEYVFNVEKINLLVMLSHSSESNFFYRTFDK